MAKSIESETYRRLRKSIEKEKELPEGFDLLVRKDLHALFGAYFEYLPQDFRMTITPLAGEGYTVAITLNASRVKKIKLL